MKFSIIGTAGRKEDGSKMSKSLYLKMCYQATFTILSKCDRIKDVVLVSGGAAWSDHVAVSLYLAKTFKKLILYLPEDLEKNRFIETENRFDAGRIANYYHELFSKKIGRDTIQDIVDAKHKGAYINVIKGFKQRNSYVAQSDYIIAFSWGNGAIPKDGGTLDTWNKAITLNKFHIPLGSLLNTPEQFFYEKMEKLSKKHKK